MTLHPLKIPGNARELRRIVAMQRLLLRALCATPMNASLINEKWLSGVWPTQCKSWVQKFCRKREYSVIEPISVIADAPLTTRQALCKAFIHQTRVKKMFHAGGQFEATEALSGFTPALAREVHRLFVRFYKFLSHETNAAWDGYIFPRGRKICLNDYKIAFDNSNRPEMTVCPYCDGVNDEPELDHYYAKESFPLLSCSPWNLVPACHHCNKIGAKAGRIAMEIGTVNPTENWLHPYFRPASLQVEIRLSGTPWSSIPRLHSPDLVEQGRLSKHVELIPTLITRWTRAASVHFDNLVTEVNRKLLTDPTATVDSLVVIKRDDHEAMRSREGFSMVHAAVCRAVLERRPEYLREFSMPNPPTLI